ncbi:MAG: GNAT family N-acetyltransferase [Cyanobacteria bacterium J06636_16]
MPTLLTSRLILEKAVEEDFEALVKLNTCPIVRRYLGGPLDYSSACKRAKHRISESPDLFWVIRSYQKQFLGVISLSKHYDSEDLEVSYQLMSDAWGKGFAQEALAKIIEYSRRELKIAKILAETQTKNFRSVNLLLRSGFEEVRKLERFGESQSLFEYNTPSHLK